MKLAIVGAGSTYTPGLVGRWLERWKGGIPIRSLTLYDIDPDRLQVVGRFVCGMLKKLAPEVEVTLTRDREAALRGSDFVVMQMRVGLNRQRQIDEHLCVEHGFIGQETTGPAGFALALRQVPVAVEVAQDLNRLAPNAWLINVANPAGILTEAILNYGHARSIGMCHGGFEPRRNFARLLGDDESRIEFDYVGLNHLAWISKVYHDGKLLSGDRLQQLAEDLYHEWRQAEINLPTGFAADFTPPLAVHTYMREYFMHEESLAEARRIGKTRADSVIEIERQCLDYYRAEAGKKVTVPAMLTKRGGVVEESERKTSEDNGAIGYSDGCLAVIDALLRPEPRRLVVNTLNRGSIQGLPDDGCVEVSALVDNRGVTRLVLGELPLQVRGQVQAVKAYETLTIKAALSGDRRVALQALLSHPMSLCRYQQTKRLWEALLEANRPFLPRFFQAASVARPSGA